MSFPPWSHSFLSNLANCPHKAFRRYVARDLPREPPSDDMSDGIKAHQAFQAYLGGDDTALGADWKPLADPLRGMGAIAEMKMGITREGRGCDFWSAEAWGRGSADAVVLRAPVALLVDWKTGKVREDPRELATHALLLKARHPELAHIKGCYAWLKENRLGPVYDLSNTNRAWSAVCTLMNDAAQYEAEQEWPKTPNALCGWCPVKDCEHNRS